MLNFSRVHCTFMTNSRISNSSNPANACSLTCGNAAEYQSDYSPEKESFIDPTTCLFGNDLFFELNFEGYESPPILPEHQEKNSITITRTPLPHSPPRAIHTPPVCEDSNQFTPPVPSPSRVNAPDYFTPPLPTSNIEYFHNVPPNCHPRDTNDKFVSPSHCKPLYQSTLPHHFHQEDYRIDQSLFSHSTMPLVIPPDNPQRTNGNNCPYSPCRSSSCPNSPVPVYKQAYCHSNTCITEHLPSPKNNNNHPVVPPNYRIFSSNTTHFPNNSQECVDKRVSRKDVTASSLTISSNETGVLENALLSQTSGSYPDDDYFCSTQQSNTQTSTYSEDTHDFTEVSSQQQEWSPPGNVEINFSPGLEKLPAEKGKISKKRKNINERERNRVRTMNMAFKELGDVCALFTNERANTKLATINQALSLLSKLDSSKPREAPPSPSRTPNKD